VVCTESASVVLGLYETFNRGDLPAAWALLDPAVSFTEPPVSRVPYAGYHSGPRSVVAAIFRHEEDLWEDFRAIPQTLVDTGESLLVLSFFKCVGRESGERYRRKLWIEISKDTRCTFPMS
jgi:ketosteroid isomerase-like protein